MTSDGEALFRAICELPGEDTPRLVYADWLEENGQPERAEFIRLQCETLAVPHATLAARRTRASVLLKAHGDRWYNELPALPGVAWGTFFVRGFIDTARTFRLVNVTAALETMFGAAPLGSLTVTELHPGQLRELLDCPLLGRLAKLSLPGITGREEARLLTAAYKRFPNTKID